MKSDHVAESLNFSTLSQFRLIFPEESLQSRLFPAQRGSLGAVRDGELGGIRTHDQRLKRALLYQLSYKLTILLYLA